MDAFFDPLDLPFFNRHQRKLTKYAILLNEPNPENGEKVKEKPCPLASELLPDLAEDKENDDLLTMFGNILKQKIVGHAEIEKVPIFKPDEIIESNDLMLVPVMYRIALENFAQTDKSVFKIIECRNITKLISDWKPSLPDKLISLGHQVIVVQLETSFVPFTDFAYAVLRQLDYEWKKRLPRSFFFPDDVCKVEATSGRDLCVVSPSMPDGDLEINKKIGLLNYELLMMIKSSCMSAMQNYLLKRDLRVGKFSDTLDGVAALRQLYRNLQEKLRSGDSIELGSDSMEDLKMLAKESGGGTDVLASQTWIEYGKRIGLPIPASASSSATSISSAMDIIERSNFNVDGDETDEDNLSIESSPAKEDSHTLSPGFGMDDGKDCQTDGSFVHGESGEQEPEGESRTNCIDDDGSNPVISPVTTEITSDKKLRGKAEILILNEDDDGDFQLETFTEFKNAIQEKMEQNRKNNDDETDDDEDQDLPLHEFSADSIIQILQIPHKLVNDQVHKSYTNPWGGYARYD